MKFWMRLRGYAWQRIGLATCCRWWNYKDHEHWAWVKGNRYEGLKTCDRQTANI